MSRRDAQYCERIVRRHARTFTLASWFLPAPKRRAAFALYAFCRVVDDVVDCATGVDRSGAARRLADHERQLSAALAGRPGNEVFRELHRAVREFGVPSAVLHELVAGIARDLEPVRYRSWLELATYCEGVASTVGEMCTYVFGVSSGTETRTAALRYARTLGVAMQLTNILRDVGEDARRGRCYLPEEDLDRFGIRPAEVLSDGRLGTDPRWAPLMRLEVERARGLYDLAMPGIPLLATDAQRCATACASGYAAILGAIEALGYDSITGRARPGAWTRAGILWASLKSKPDRADPSIVSAGPHLEWEKAASGRTPANVARWA